MYKTKFKPIVGSVVAYTYTPRYTCPCCGRQVPGAKATVKAKVTSVVAYRQGGKRGLEVTIHTGEQEVILYNSDFYNKCARIS